MKPINVLSLVIWFVPALSIGFSYSAWAQGNGYHIPVSPLTLTLSLAVVSIILLALALPIYRYKRALKKILEAKDASKIERPVPVDPFYAVKVLLLAKASAVTAALFIGWHAGVIIFILNAPVLAQDALNPNVASGVVSVLLLIIAFLVQGICKLPNDAGPKDGSVPA